MARRKKGRKLTGWLLVDKPSGPGSTDIVNRARWLLQAQKAGHAGTLDPAATGLLILAFGEATKALPVLTDALKTYTFTVRWGAATETDDAEGAVIETSALRPTRDEIEAALPAFRGEIEQTPPAFSAVRVEGQRAYDLARRGDAPELSPRPLFVDRLELGTSDAERSELLMTCGKGGYVRAIGRDLGRALGCLGHVEQLRRTATGPFDVADSVDWASDPDGEMLEAALLPLEAGLNGLPSCHCAAHSLGRLKNGNSVEVLRTDAANGDLAWAEVGGAARALGIYRFGEFQPNRVFNLDPH